MMYFTNYINKPKKNVIKKKNINEIIFLIMINHQYDSVIFQILIIEVS